MKKFFLLTLTVPLVLVACQKNPETLILQTQSNSERQTRIIAQETQPTISVQSQSGDTNTGITFPVDTTDMGSVYKTYPSGTVFLYDKFQGDEGCDSLYSTVFRLVYINSITGKKIYEDYYEDATCKPKKGKETLFNQAGELMEVGVSCDDACDYQKTTTKTFYDLPNGDKNRKKLVLKATNLEDAYFEYFKEKKPKTNMKFDEQKIEKLFVGKTWPLEEVDEYMIDTKTGENIHASFRDGKIHHDGTGINDDLDQQKFSKFIDFIGNNQLSEATIMLLDPKTIVHGDDYYSMGSIWPFNTDSPDIFSAKPYSNGILTLFHPGGVDAGNYKFGYITVLANKMYFFNIEAGFECGKMYNNTDEESVEFDDQHIYIYQDMNDSTGTTLHFPCIEKNNQYSGNERVIRWFQGTEKNTEFSKRMQDFERKIDSLYQ